MRFSLPAKPGVELNTMPRIPIPAWTPVMLGIDSVAATVIVGPKLPPCRMYQ